MTTRRTRLGTRMLIVGLSVLGVFLLLWALTRPSAGRFLAGGLLVGAALVVRHNALTRDDPARYTRSAQVRSVVWSVLIVVVFVGASYLLNEALTD